jgi:hypothetical protein
MLIALLDHSLTFANEISSIDSFLDQVEEILKENQVYIDHMEIDGVIIYQDFQEYLFEHIRGIKQINIKVQTMKQLLDESMITMQFYLEGALPEVKSLADEFYQGATKDSWDKLNQLLEGLMWICQTLETILSKQVYQDKFVYLEVSSALHEELSNLEGALTDTDMVLTADILKHEIISIFDNLLLAVTNTIDNEVVRNDLS